MLLLEQNSTGKSFQLKAGTQFSVCLPEPYEYAYDLVLTHKPRGVIESSRQEVEKPPSEDSTMISSVPLYYYYTLKAKSPGSGKLVFDYLYHHGRKRFKNIATFEITVTP